MTSNEYNAFLRRGLRSGLCPREGSAFEELTNSVDEQDCILLNPNFVLHNLLLPTGVAIGKHWGHVPKCTKARYFHTKKCENFLRKKHISLPTSLPRGEGTSLPTLPLMCPPTTRFWLRHCFHRYFKHPSYILRSRANSRVDHYQTTLIAFVSLISLTDYCINYKIFY